MPPLAFFRHSENTLSQPSCSLLPGLNGKKAEVDRIFGTPCRKMAEAIVLFCLLGETRNVELFGRFLGDTAIIQNPRDDRCQLGHMSLSFVAG